MICYKDKSFCASKACKNKCNRKFTKEMHYQAVKWWGGDDYPLCMMSYCDENGELLRKESNT